jgi:formylglycine-generating enzyme required for sulfatase activity
MDLRQAYETLGLARGASAEEIEAAYERLRGDLEARLERVSAAPVHTRFHELRSRFDDAREMLLSLPRVQSDEPLADAFALLGLRPGASALDVASAYVALCEEIEREARDAPTEELRRACLEARADVDAAYQQCALSPLRGEPELESPGGEPQARYQTQMSAAPFEARPAHEDSGEATLQIEPEREPDSPRRRRRSRGGRVLRGLGLAASLLLLLAGGAVGLAWWEGLDPTTAFERYAPRAWVERFAPSANQAELAEVRSTVDYLRRRIGDERRDLAARAEESAARVRELEQAWAAASIAEERERIALELSRARARRDLSSELAELAERHVLSGPDLTVAYGKIEVGTEQLADGDGAEALAAFAEARTLLEATLRRLDLAERAVGARSEAEEGLEAWRALARSADLEELPAVRQGLEILAGARSLLSEGKFEESTPELRRAAQQFSAALAEGRRRVAALRASEAPPVPGEPAAETSSLELTGAESRVVPEPIAADEPARLVATLRETPPVAAPPRDPERAAIKLVQVPAGEFFYGCNAAVEPDCEGAERPGRRLALAAFQIDRTEVRVGEYRACVQAAACTPPAGGPGCNWGDSDREDQPVNCVDWGQANAYCAWVGKRLPSEREWEKAARGTDGRLYPWGNGDASCDEAVIANGEAAGCGRDSTWPVASRAEGRSPFGLFDMAGNVLEWTGDPSELDGERVVRGGSWRSVAAAARASFRAALPAGSQDPRLGFRCAQDDALFAASSTR